MAVRDEEEADGEDGVGGQQLHAFEPVAFPILLDHVDQQEGDADGDELKEAEDAGSWACRARG